MGRTPRCEKINGLKRGPWTQEEDQKLVDYIQKHGHGSWRMLPKNAGLSRCGKSCRLRWTNYLRPDIKRGRFSFEEEETIIQLHSILGNKWSAIAGRLPGRTDNEIKNYWNTHIRKRLLRMGIDPVTHNPRLDLLDLSSLLSQQPFYNNPSQLDVSRLVLGDDPIVNSELLRIATDLLSAQEQNSNFLQPNIQEVQKPPFPSFQSHQLPEIPACTTSEATFLLEQTNLDDGTPCNFSDNFVSPQGCGNYMYKNPTFDPKMENFKFGSVLSTPSSSSPTHLNSSSTYINSSTEDERDSYCSNGFNFQIPDLLDMSDFSLF